MIDEKGRLFGKLNIVDLLVILVVLVAVVVLGVKFLGKDGGGGINPGKTQVTYTVLVKGVEQEVYDNIQKYIPGQLMASGEMLDGQVVSVEPRAHEQTVTVDQIKTSATPAPTEPPADSAVSGETTTEPTAAPTEAPQPDNSGTGETINVTMNGTAQTMDLVQCLAMVAQNELGPNAPAEAYKAQCVATHCWIISQSGYPSVLGAEPGAAALAAAQEVAHVLVTYNGQVCFTPYFASASTGTASAAEVWGNDRAWLQAVDSPYDQSVSSHWNTNGNSSGTARFSRQTLQDRIRDVMDIDLSGVDPNSWFTIQSANQYGWVAKIQVGPDAGVGTVSGRWFRENLLARQSVDGRSLRSQCFTVSYNADLDCFIFDVYGYGHGCGMSQWGAIGYARNGWGYQDILTHYFVGTTITTY